MKESYDKLINKEKEVWDLGYWSTDQEEDNDTSEEEIEEEEEEYYDEEDEKEEIDPTDLIKQEKDDKSMKPEEKQYLASASEIEKQILKKNENLDKKKA